MENKLPRCLFIGKFFPLHLGHKKAITTLRGMFGNLVVAIGSPQNETFFTLDDRKKMLKESLEIIDPLVVEDLDESHPLYNNWGEYVIKKTGSIDIVASGNEYVKQDFLNVGIPVMVLPRYDEISGTKIREKIISRDPTWEDLVDFPVRRIIKESAFYRAIGTK